MDFTEQKKILRQTLKPFLKMIDWESISSEFHKNLHVFLNFSPSIMLAGYCPLSDEPSITPFLEEWRQKGGKCCLPVIVSENTPLDFYEWTDEMPVLPLRSKRSLPVGYRSVSPDVLLIPGIAFDLDGYRLGRGGGYFDRTLAYLRLTKNITAIGIASSQQIFPSLPFQKHDQKLNAIITEKFILNNL